MQERNMIMFNLKGVLLREASYGMTMSNYLACHKKLLNGAKQLSMNIKSGFIKFLNKKYDLLKSHTREHISLNNILIDCL